MYVSVSKGRFRKMNLCSSLDIRPGYGLDRWGSVFRSRPSLEPIRSPIRWASRALSPKWNDWGVEL